jgi:hypothetical protein
LSIRAPLATYPDKPSVGFFLPAQLRPVLICYHHRLLGDVSQERPRLGIALQQLGESRFVFLAKLCVQVA